MTPERAGAWERPLSSRNPPELTPQTNQAIATARDGRSPTGPTRRTTSRSSRTKREATETSTTRSDGVTADPTDASFSICFRERAGERPRRKSPRKTGNPYAANDDEG